MSPLRLFLHIFTANTKFYFRFVSRLTRLRFHVASDSDGNVVFLGQLRSPPHANALAISSFVSRSQFLTR